MIHEPWSGVDGEVGPLGAVRVGTGNQFDEYQKALYEKQWTWHDIPFYSGKDPKLSIAPFHNLEYLDVYEKTYGRKMGSVGIGRLREVALTKITEAENQLYAEGFPYVTDRELLEAHGLKRIPDISLCQEQQESYAAVLEGAGVTVHWIDWGVYPVGAFGPMQAMWAAGDLLVINGGAVVPKVGWHPFSFGRAEWLSRWAFWNLNIPTLLTVAGKGVAEAGATTWLAQDVYVVGLSAAYNQDGLDQLLSVVNLTSGVEDLNVLTIRCQGAHWFDEETGATAHVTNLIAPLDIHTVVCYPPGIDSATLLWLERAGYSIIEADPNEHIENKVCNLVVLEPGRVIMAAEAKKTIAQVRNAGIEVIDVPYSGFHAAGGSLGHATMKIYREPGPARFE